MSAAIPILNLYYLLTYAWDQYQPGEAREIGAEDCPDVENLFAVMLSGGLRQLARRGMDRDYIPHTEETSRLRGKLHLMESVRRQTPLAGRMICSFDDLSSDVLHNQILKSTALSLLKRDELTQENRKELRHALEPLAQVREIRLSGQMFRRVQLHRNNRIYRFLLGLCELVQRLVMPADHRGGERIVDLLRDEVIMHSLFEKFVRNFAVRHCHDATVGAKAVQWSVEAEDSALARLPVMFTDITLDWPDRKLIVDCKYYAEAMSSHHGASKLKSENLYQLLAYLKNQSELPDWESVEGLLIYPTNGASFDLKYRLLGNPVRAATLDLNQPWEAIHKQLTGLLCDGEASLLNDNPSRE
ncbi:MAG: hypothetical protein JNJ83_06395 [Verrucomicrobiaceae bacterium]|nr:hypothetical protein [Verrucomicrobiaceae bacterium]